jgi:acetylornithine/N-succinyldiaminopimelate aminotransferase
MSNEVSSSLMPVTPRPANVMVRGQGSWIWDEAGKRYLDFVQGWAVNCLGHAPPVIRKALADQAGRLLTPSPALHNRPQLELADLLTAHAGLDRVFFCNSGAEANEGAIKLARKWGRVRRPAAVGQVAPYEIITMEGSFHGRTLATMAASGKPGWDEIFPPAMPGFRKVAYGDVGELERAIGDQTLAVMLEPIQGEAGVIVPPDGYLAALRLLTREAGLLLIADEIQTGMGRCGNLFACQGEDVLPDIMTLGKGLGGGVPIAAMLCREEVFCFDTGDQGGTYNGNPLMTAVGLAVLRTLTAAGFLESVSGVADYLRSGLEDLSTRVGCGTVRGRGMLLALVLPAPVGVAVRDACFDAGLLINSPRPELLRFMPPLTLNRREVDDMLGTLEPVLISTLRG